jgi:predicted phosphodiesterase
MLLALRRVQPARCGLVHVYHLSCGRSTWPLQFGQVKAWIRRSLFPVVTLGSMLIGCSSTPAPLDEGRTRGTKSLPAGVFEFGVVGDAPYDEEEAKIMQDLIKEMNEAPLAFVVHIGDIHSGTTPCTDQAYRSTARRFSEFEDPVIYTPGDNDWMDCERTGFRPRERLRFLRQMFFIGRDVLGGGSLEVERQSQVYPENARWVYNDLVFVAVHNVGGNNNRDADAAEYMPRNEANLGWLRESFELARSRRSRGLVVATHADPGFERHRPQAGYRDLLELLATESRSFDGEVLLIHGDTHFYRVDQPLVDRDKGRIIPNFTRVETFGSPDVGWVRVTVDARSDDPFAVRPERVASSLL